MANNKLVKFIKEARKRGLDDYQIRTPLLKHGWPYEEIEEAFLSLKPKFKYKNKMTIFLSNDILRKLQIRADKNLFTIHEQIEDILRRSTISTGKKTAKEEKLDDKLVALFSRKRTKKG